MRQFFKDIASDDEIEIIPPERRAVGSRCSALCLCCERADQPMDDDVAEFAMHVWVCPLARSPIRMGLNFQTPSPIYRSLPVIDDCLQRWSSVARS